MTCELKRCASILDTAVSRGKVEALCSRGYSYRAMELQPYWISECFRKQGHLHAPASPYLFTISKKYTFVTSHWGLKGFSCRLSELNMWKKSQVMVKEKLGVIERIWAKRNVSLTLQIQGNSNLTKGWKGNSSGPLSRATPAYVHIPIATSITVNKSNNCHRMIF